jgi:hypothetical protein
MIFLGLAAFLEHPLAQAAPTRPIEVATRFDPASCHGETSDKAYVGLFRLVFRFPGVHSIGGTTEYPTANEQNGPGAPWHRVELYPPRPVQPDPTVPEGCPEHPAQRYRYKIEGAQLAALLVSPSDSHRPNANAGDDTVSLSPMQPGEQWLGSTPPMLPAKSPGPYCGPDDAEAMARRARISGCLYRSGDDWFGGVMTKPAPSDVPRVRFFCSGSCMIRVVFEPGLFLLAFHRVNNASPVPPIEQVTDFQQRLWRGLQRAEVRNYKWAAPRKDVSPAP